MKYSALMATLILSLNAFAQINRPVQPLDTRSSSRSSPARRGYTTPSVFPRNSYYKRKPRYSKKVLSEKIQESEEKIISIKKINAVGYKDLIIIELNKIAAYSNDIRTLDQEELDKHKKIPEECVNTANTEAADFYQTTTQPSSSIPPMLIDDN